MRAVGDMDFVTLENMALLTDLYELAMAAAYYEHRRTDEATFELFVRRLPPERSYLMFAGLERALEYLKRLAFTPVAIQYLRSTRTFSSKFLTYLEGLRFRGDVEAMPEGTVFFPNEPVLRVTANIVEAQVVETFLLNAVTLATVIASKAARVVEEARGRPVVEFGVRRAQGVDAGLIAARAAYIAGCAGTSNVLAGRHYGIPVFGTMAHAFVQAFPAEIDAFRAFVRTFPRGTTLLIDTYDTLEGARRAVRVAGDLRRAGGSLGAVRLDSGDLHTLSRQVRKILDEAGCRDVKIFASGNLNEYYLADLVKRGAPIDAFGVGTDLSVSVDAPSVDTVYKLCEVVHDGRRIPTMKQSTNKGTYPGRKQVFRIVRNKRMAADTLGLEGERMSGRPLLAPVVRRGRRVSPTPGLHEIRRYAEQERMQLPPAVRTLERKSRYPVRISPGLDRLIRDCRRERAKREEGVNA